MLPLGARKSTVAPADTEPVPPTPTGDAGSLVSVLLLAVHTDAETLALDTLFMFMVPRSKRFVGFPEHSTCSFRRLQSPTIYAQVR